MLIEYAAAHIQHMQKAMPQLNLQLHHVIADITGLTGMRIIRAIVGGGAEPEEIGEHETPPNSLERGNNREGS
jgi:hypothetical protein